MLDNGIVRARFNTKGQLTGLRVRGQELEIQKAEFRAYPDHPANFDAWDIDRGTLALGQAVLTDMPLKVVEQGPVRSVLQGQSALGERSQALVRFILEQAVIICRSKWMSIGAKIM